MIRGARRHIFYEAANSSYVQRSLPQSPPRHMCFVCYRPKYYCRGTSGTVFGQSAGPSSGLVLVARAVKNNYSDRCLAQTLIMLSTFLTNEALVTHAAG
jgi:hypothetical protein